MTKAHEIRRMRFACLVIALCFASSSRASDCNSNGVEDACDIDCAAGGCAPPDCGRSSDCDANTIPDECEIDVNSPAPGGPFFCTFACADECNDNGILDVCEVPDCPPVDVVFIVDTSDSQERSIDDICAAIGEAISELAVGGPPFLAEVLAIWDTREGDPDAECTCCTGTVKDVYGTAANGYPNVEQLGVCGPTGQGELEDWGPATAIVAANKNWTDGPRIIFPISDEGPRCGTPILDPGSDRDAIDHAIAATWGERVIAAPVVDGGQLQLRVLARDMVEGGAPGGLVLEITDEGLGRTMVDIVRASCAHDCNGNQAVDSCDLAGGTSNDCRGGEEDCCTVHATPGCTNFDIETLVCGFFNDPCCTTSWDAFCVEVAEASFIGCVIPDSVPDECQPLAGDCNGNGISDTCDVSCGAVGGLCDVPGCGTFADCNDNCTLDVCEIDENSSAPGGPFFCTLNCAADCADNGVPDDCEVPPICATCSDCNLNDVPDVCDADCNANAVPDDCDLTAGSSCDMDGDGVPDECGACCEDSVCRDTMSWLCQFGDYADGVPCGTYECAIAACCLGSTCRDDLNESQCEAIPGSSAFTIDTSCSPNPCNNGACCRATGACLVGESETSCGDQGGIFFGGTDCSTPGVCDAPIVDCDNDCLDDDPPGSTATVLTNTSYACDDSLSRVMNNVLRFQFACPISLPSAGDVEVRELLPDGFFGTQDLSANFTFTLEGTPGSETILRIEENGDVLAHKTWYTVRNVGEWAGVANFQVDYAAIYGDADNLGGTGFSDLATINNNLTSGPDCPDDSRFDIDTLGCVAFADMATAFNYIPSSVAKPTGHDCPGSAQQSQGGGSSPESSSSLSASTTLEPAGSLTAANADTPASFAAWLPDFLSDLEIPEHQRADGLDELLDALVTWAVENLTDDERDTVAGALSDPQRTFTDPAVAARSRDMAGAIAP